MELSHFVTDKAWRESKFVRLQQVMEKSRDGVILIDLLESGGIDVEEAEVKVCGVGGFNGVVSKTNSSFFKFCYYYNF
jgi:hypothetical protein